MVTTDSRVILFRQPWLKTKKFINSLHLSTRRRTSFFYRSGSANSYHWIKHPDAFFFFNGFQDVKRIKFFHLFVVNILEDTALYSTYIESFLPHTNLSKAWRRRPSISPHVRRRSCNGYLNILHTYWFYQCCGSGSGSVGPMSEIRIRIQMLLSSSKNSKKNIDSYCFVTHVCLIFEKWCRKKNSFCGRLEGHWRKKQDPDTHPDTLVRGMDPRI